MFSNYSIFFDEIWLAVCPSFSFLSDFSAGSIYYYDFNYFKNAMGSVRHLLSNSREDYLVGNIYLDESCYKFLYENTCLSISNLVDDLKLS